MTDETTKHGAGAPTPDDASGGAGLPVPVAAPGAAGAAGTGRAELTPQERAQVEQIKRTVDVEDTQTVLQYGLPAQNKIATFADTLLADIRTREAGQAGESLAELLVKVKEVDVDSLSGGSGLAKIPLVGRFVDSFNRFATRYQKIGATIEKLTLALEKARMGLLKDITVLDRMYELNLEYLGQLDLYIAAGDELLEELQTERLPVLEAEAQASQDPLDAQRVNDVRQAVLRFERRLHDLKLTRMIAIQTAPQVRLIQSNDQNLVEKIQSSILTTVPLWKNQIVIALSLYRQQKALELQREVSDTTNELLVKNAALLKDGSAKVAREVERGVVDIETLRQVNADLVATLEETISIQDEGRRKRHEAEDELVRLQADLRQKLIELRGTQSAEPPRLDAVTGGPQARRRLPADGSAPPARASAAEHRREPRQRLVQRRPRAGEVEPQVAGRAEVGAVGERDAGATADRGRVVEPEPADVEPGEVGRLDVRHRHARERRADEALERVAVAAQVREQLLEPRPALAIRRLRGGEGEAAGERQHAGGRGREAPAQPLVGHDGEGEVETRQVVGLARRHQGHGHLRRRGTDGRRGHVRQVVEHEVAVDLVRAEHEPVPATELDHGGDLVAPPHAPEGVVRVAEEQHAGARRERRLHLVERQLPAAAGVARRHRQQPALLLGRRLEERRVDGGHGHDLVVRRRRTPGSRGPDPGTTLGSHTSHSGSMRQP